MATIEQTWIYRKERVNHWTWLIPFAGALCLHLLFVLVIPDQFTTSSSATKADEDKDIVELTLLPPEPLTPEEMRYVEANPEAPENKPDESDQYSFRDQQAADQKVSEIPLNAPNVDGELEDSTKILQGAVEPAPPMPEGVYRQQTQPGEGEGTDGGKAGAEAQAAPKPAQPKPAPAFLQQKPETSDGTGSTLDLIGQGDELVKNPSQDAPIDLYRPTQNPTNQEPSQTGDGSGGSPDAKPVPRDRPRLSPELIHGPLTKSQGSAPRRGVLALDATFSEFGEYEQQFYAALQAGWYQEIEFFQPIDTATRVQVRFKIKSDGTIVGTKVVSSNASEIATIICETAITKRSPYRPWTKDMVRVFGEEKVLTVTFHYR